MSKEAIKKNRSLVSRIKSKRDSSKHGKVISFRPPPDLNPLVEDALKDISQADLLTEWGRAYYGIQAAEEQAAS